MFQLLLRMTVIWSACSKNLTVPTCSRLSQPALSCRSRTYTFRRKSPSAPVDGRCRKIDLRGGHDPRTWAFLGPGCSSLNLFDASRDSMDPVAIASGSSARMSLSDAAGKPMFLTPSAKVLGSFRPPTQSATTQKDGGRKKHQGNRPSICATCKKEEAKEAQRKTAFGSRPCRCLAHDSRPQHPLL